MLTSLIVWVVLGQLPGQLPSSTQPTAYVFSVDVAAGDRRNATMWVDNATSTFRLAFRAKDAAFDALELPPWLSGWPLVVSRALELLALDFPLAILGQTFPHEVDGHGARIRDLGGTATYTFAPPFPYGLATSFYEQQFQRPLSADEQALIAQGGLVAEAVARQQTLLTSYEAGTWSHGDAFQYFGWNLHLAGYGALPTGDAANWSDAMSARFQVDARQLQRQYLVTAALVEGLDPLFLYSLWCLGRFVALGERRRETPTVRVGPVGLFASTHLQAMPWGNEVSLDILVRTSFGVFDVAPRLGGGPGGSSGGVALSLRGLRVWKLSLAAEVDVWSQPPVQRFVPGGPAGVGSFLPAPKLWGASGAVEVAFIQDTWLLGVRVGGKSPGLHGVDPIGTNAELTVRVGLRLH